MLRRNVEAYAQEHDVRSLVGELTQSIMVRMPEDPRRFLAAELGRQLQQQADDRDELGAMPRDSFVLSLNASEGHGREGAGGRALRWRRVLSRAPSGRMARYQAERELTEQLRAVIWGGSAGGGEHHELHAEPLQAEPSASLPVPDQAAPAIPHALVLALIGLDDAGLRREFDDHADIAPGNEGERRMSKTGLASFMCHKGLAHGEAEVERFLARVDANNDGEIDFGEFRALARANSDLELVLRSKRLECVLCAFFPSGTTLENLASMDRSQFAGIVDLSKPALVQLLVDLAAQMAAVGKAQDAAGEGKFTGELEGGPLDEFYKGVTGVCGEPDADIEKGMREEHTERPDSRRKFSTSNYGLKTTPAKEWELVVEGGSGCAKVEGKEDSIIVRSTRGCCKASGLKWFNAGNADPTTFGLKWIAVGDTQPTEGRQLSNAMLADALAPSKPAPKCPTAQHEMVISTGTYNEFLCNRCGASKSGERWFCGNCRDDFCFECEPLRMLTVDFTKEDLHILGVTDLRSTDFIEAGGCYFKPTASTAQLLEKPSLAHALMRKTEFTQQEWDAFGVHDLRMHHFVKSGDSYFHPAGEEQPDVRVLRPLAHYGDFGEDGRLKWGVGDEVAVGEALTVTFEGQDHKKELAKDTEGKVLEFNAKGAAKIAFREPVSAEWWVSPDQIYRLYPRPRARDTPIQRMVKLGRLRRCEVIALILYTGVYVPVCACVRVRAHAALVCLTPCRLSQPIVDGDASAGESLSSSRTNPAHSSDLQGRCLSSTTRSCAALAPAARSPRASSLSPTNFGRSGRRSTSTHGRSTAATSTPTPSTRSPRRSRSCRASRPRSRAPASTAAWAGLASPSLPRASASPSAPL